MRQPLHVKAMGLHMFHTFVLTLATTLALPVVLPTIAEDFNAPVTTVVWILIAYFLGLGGATVALGDITTYFDRRALVVLGLAVDVLVMSVIFFTTDIYVFIICRFLSAAFRVFLWVILQVIAIGGFPPERRGKAVGYSMFASGLGLVLSTTFTGFVADNLGWRWLFMGTSVVYLAMIPAVFLLLPKLPPEAENRKPLSEFDFLGSVLLVVGAIALITSGQLLVLGLSSDASTALPAVLAVTAVASLAGFVWVELHAEAPILKLSIFRIPSVTLAAAQATVMGFATGSIGLMLPFMLRLGYGWSQAHLGNVLIAQNAARPPAGPVAGYLSDKFGSVAVFLPAAGINVIGQIGLALLGASPAVHVVVGVLLIWGTGQAVMQTANMRQIFASLPANQLHLAPSLNLTMSTLGITAGFAFGSLAIDRAQDASEGGAAFLDRMDEALLVVTVLFTIGIIVAQLLPRLLLRSGTAALETVEALPPAAADAGSEEETTR